jgi:hypothetical protein
MQVSMHLQNAELNCGRKAIHEEHQIVKQAPEKQNHDRSKEAYDSAITTERLPMPTLRHQEARHENFFYNCLSHLLLDASSANIRSK